MSPSAEHRKLVAIMFTDMVGYTALSQLNESLALELLEEHRGVLRGLLAKFSGHEIKTIGDGFLIEFSSALAAVECAIEIQRSFADRNRAIPAGRRVQVRIGIHAGDVVHRDGDLLGDGVNIASRIQPLAEPGGICLSHPVADQVRNKIGLPLIRLGGAGLKDVDADVDLYRLTLPWQRQASPLASWLSYSLSRKGTLALGALWLAVALLGGLIVWQHRLALETVAKARKEPVAIAAASLDRKRIAVLPFDNFSRDANDEYFAEGMHGQLISTLSKISGLQVIARTSVMTYKTRLRTVAEIGKDLDVGTVLEGSVRKAGAQIRVTVQLIDAATQAHLWTQDYDALDLKDVFSIQSEVAEKVASALQITLLTGEKSQLRKAPTESWEAAEYYFKGLYLVNKRTADDLRASIVMFQKAIGFDPKFALGYAALADAYSLLCVYRELQPRVGFPKAKEAALKAFEIDRSSSEATAALAFVAHHYEWKWLEAEKRYQQALHLNAGNASAHHWYATLLAETGRFEKAMSEIQIAEKFAPLSPAIRSTVGWIKYLQQDYPAAVAHFEGALSVEAKYTTGHVLLGMAYSQTGAYAEAIASLERASALSRGPCELPELGYAYAAKGMKAEARQMLSRLISCAGPPTPSAYGIASIYAALGDAIEAFTWLKKAEAERSSDLLMLNMDPRFAALRSDTAFKDLIRRLGMPSGQ